MERPGSTHTRNPLPRSLASALRNEAADLGGLFMRLVSHTKSAAQVDMADGKTLARELRVSASTLDRWPRGAGGCPESAIRYGNSRLPPQVRKVARALVDGFGVRNVNTELVFAQTGRNIRMRGSIYVRIHADGEARLHAAVRRQRIDQGQLAARIRN